MAYRYGREEDEIIPGLPFLKELVVDRVEVYPDYQNDKTTKLQVILILCINI